MIKDDKERKKRVREEKCKTLPRLAGLHFAEGL